MTRCPTTLECHVCRTPSTPVTIAIAIIPPTSRFKRRVSRCGMASSSSDRNRNGVIMPSVAEAAIRNRTEPRRTL